MKVAAPEHYLGEELEGLAGTLNYQKWIADQFNPYLHGRIMEIGAGIGTMSRKWLARASKLHLVEPAKNLFPILYKGFHAFPNVVLHHGGLEQVLSDNPSLSVEAFDAIVMVNVLEHIEDDSGILKKIYRMLKPGGYLLIFVPAMPILFGSLDEKFGHYRRYTKRELAARCGDIGYEIVLSRYFDIFGVLPWWLVNRVLRSSRLNPSLANLYDRWAVPFARRLEKLIAPPCGKNLVLIARKAED